MDKGLAVICLRDCRQFENLMVMAMRSRVHGLPRLGGGGYATPLVEYLIVWGLGYRAHGFGDRPPSSSRRASAFLKANSFEI